MVRPCMESAFASSHEALACSMAAPLLSFSSRSIASMGLTDQMKRVFKLIFEVAYGQAIVREFLR